MLTDIKKIKTHQSYWWCQIIGWSIYAIILLFIANTFDSQLNNIVNKRVILMALTGFGFTHLLRYYLIKTNLLPPLIGQQWIKITALVLLVSVAFSLLNSALFEVLGLYNVKMKANIPKRFVFIFFDYTPIIIIWVLIYYVWQYVVSINKSEIDRIRLQALVQTLELETIKSHINPHFIFNALNSIRALVDENPAQARKAVTQLSNLLRSSLLSEKNNTTTVAQELEIVKDYLALEHIRFEDRLNASYHIDPNSLQQLIPPMMLQTLVENAIKHGIANLVKGGTIDISSTCSKQIFELTVVNTGQLKLPVNSNGFGVTATKNQLALLFGNKASFELKNLNDTQVQAKVVIQLA